MDVDVELSSTPALSNNPPQAQSGHPRLQEPSHLLLDGGDGHTSNGDSDEDKRPSTGASQDDHVDEHQFPDVGLDHDSSELPQESGKADSDTKESVLESERDEVGFVDKPSAPQSSAVASGNLFTYHSVTCTPDQFPNVQPEILRSRHGLPTKLCIAVTMYNEPLTMLTKTIEAIRKNIAFMKQRPLAGYSQKDETPLELEIVVCVIADGRAQLHESVLKEVRSHSQLGESFLSGEAEKGTTAHIMEFLHEQDKLPKLDMLFCVKEKNQGKLDSHRWLFKAFCPLIRPEVCVLLDVGTQPRKNAIYELWECFQHDPSVGGACGEICADAGGWMALLKNPLAAAQLFEYKMSNILDKPFESAIGYISVLPGAFSAYRYVAISRSSTDNPDSESSCPLDQYLALADKYSTSEGPDNLLVRNMYLAEDRILGFEVFARPNHDYILKYVKNAKADTDAVMTMSEFIRQRRRWLNGTLFATMFFMGNAPRIWGSKHSIPRRVAISSFQLILTFTSLANFYLSLAFILVTATVDADQDAFNFLWHGAGMTIRDIYLKSYLAVMLLMLIYSLGNKPRHAEYVYLIFMSLLAIHMYCMINVLMKAFSRRSADDATSAAFAFEDNAVFGYTIVALASTVGLLVIASILHGEILYLAASGIQYVLLVPSYVNILTTYAICNIHDVSWGTKGTVDPSGPKKRHDDGLQENDKNMEDDKVSTPILDNAERGGLDGDTDDQAQRTHIVAIWIPMNCALALIFDPIVTPGLNVYISFLIWSFVLSSGIRFLGSLCYVVQEQYMRWRRRRVAESRIPAVKK
ncbi:chitin synthase-domain-containing protein [Earliella scabrosa]|nr:chitin synthase-domain-containing protein [Earliella scabrosa]